MPDIHSLVNRLHYDGHREYSKTQGNIAYLDGSPLKRPAEMPRMQRIIAWAFVIAAVVIGAVIINNLVIARWQTTATAEKAIAENLSRQSSIETIPNMAEVIGLDNDSIEAKFEEAGYALYDATGLDDSYDLMLLKAPSDMTAEEAGTLYRAGIGSLDAVDASRLLEGSWLFAANRANGTSMVVRYADFTTGDPQIAVQSAVKKEGFDLSLISESGTDESGNTYSSGTLDADGTACSWKVSALALDDMYPISGLPKDACYIGIRVTVL